MIGFPILIMVVLILALPVFVVVRRVRQSRPFLDVDSSRHAPFLAGRRRAVGWRWVGLGLGVIAALLTASVGSLGVGLILVPPVFGLCVIAGVVVGELTAIPRLQGARTAALETRSVRTYLPRRLSGLVAVSTVGLGVLLVITTLTGSADDMGRAGRSLSRQSDPMMSSGASPWPGLFYSVPLGIAVAIGLLGAVFALRVVVLRPRGGSAPDLVAADDVLRRRSAEAVVAATGVMVAGSLFAVAVLAGMLLVGFYGAPESWTIFGVVLLAVGAIMLLLTGGYLALLLVGPRIRPTESGETAVVGQDVRL